MAPVRLLACLQLLIGAAPVVRSYRQSPTAASFSGTWPAEAPSGVARLYGAPQQLHAGKVAAPADPRVRIEVAAWGSSRVIAEAASAAVAVIAAGNDGGQTAAAGSRAVGGDPRRMPVVEEAAGEGAAVAAARRRETARGGTIGGPPPTTWRAESVRPPSGPTPSSLAEARSQARARFPIGRLLQHASPLLASGRRGIGGGGAAADAARGAGGSPTSLGLTRSHKPVSGTTGGLIFGGAGPLTTLVTADDGGVIHFVEVPQDWAARFVAGSVQTTEPSEGPQKAGFRRYMGTHFKAELNCGGQGLLPVAFRSIPYTTPHLLMELRSEEEIAAHLRDSGSFVQRYERVHFERHSFVLEEATNFSLEELLLRYPAGALEARRMSLNQTLPLLADILRGVVDLEAAGVALTALDTESVRLKDGRALIAELAGASLLNEWSAKFGYPLQAARYLHPPESSSGFPTGPSCNVWAVGRIFARMHMGGDPIYQAVIRAVDPDLLLSEVDVLINNEEEVHLFLSTTFNIAEDLVFDKLDRDVQTLLRHLLDRDAETRWTAAEALEHVTDLAATRGISLPPKREPPRLPDCVGPVPYSSWQ